MSAYVLGAESLALVSCAVYLADLKEDGEDWTFSRVIERVVMANLESVGFRYSMTCDDAAGDVGQPGRLALIARVEALAATKLQAVKTALENPECDLNIEVYGALRSYRYQSCETPDWRESRVARWVNACIDALGGEGREIPQGAWA